MDGYNLSPEDLLKLGKGMFKIKVIIFYSSNKSLLIFSSKFFGHLRNGIYRVSHLIVSF